jgi:small multidrug resistance family-3 protein
MAIIKSLFLFILAGICEIGGGYLVWQWMKDGKPGWLGLAGGIILFLYGIVATFQAANFSRTYATYGGIFIVLSLLWGWKVDGTVPDKIDIIGGLIALVGVSVIMYWPRN